MDKNFKKSSIQNASFSILLQILFRCITFVSNAFVLRHISQDVIAVMNVRLLLLESTILFLSREAFRRACLSKTVNHNWIQVVNLLWLTVPLCCILSAVFGWIWLTVLEIPDPAITKYYTIGVWSIIISCILEMLIEPLDLVSQAFLFVKLRVVLDTIHVLLRTFLFIAIVFLWPEGAVVAFSVAQITTVIVHILGFFLYFSHYINERNNSKKDASENDFPFTSMKHFLPRIPEGQAVVDWNLCVLTWTFMKQGVMKQVLTEGERYIMTLFSVLTFSEQGVFDIVNNLGSLAARLLFRPIEDNAYFYFTQRVHRDIPLPEQSLVQITEASTVLKQLLRTVVSIGLVIFVFGQAYARLALLLYGGNRLATGLAPLLLKAHSLAILFIAVNGTTEGYSLATMDTNQLNRFNKWMVILSIGFLFVSWLLTMLFGSLGLILANCCNMAARITHSIKFINKQYKKTQFNPLGGLIPGWRFLATLAISLIVTLLSEIYFYDKAKFLHFSIGATCFLLVVGTWAYEERELFQVGVKVGVEKWRRHSLASKED